ncbi:hypothetical protein BT96DRAFT_284215 [Gymnopus androsaceus JB14]|uniref:F-box domain-containing protein n=1 Tax=Gymnopus androsaceus JB14 TaxID=1447944 RepID=A0A6A4I874_9AGAR|nr:hypothetical protein BT96DRAFT_284215 [Gymnopus androsaceus JB14]
MTRQSHRIKERRGSSGDCDMLTVSSTSTSSNGALNEPDNNFEAEEHEEARPRKRAKKSSSNEEYQSTGSSTKKMKRRMPENFRKVRGKLGMLERLAKDVPLDVIFEIFCYLDPSDLLRLARTSNDLRGILMSKSSESIWCTTRSNLEGFLPPLPPDLNEPQYAHLLYESHCHVCDRKGRCDTVLWSFRMRCCKRCIVKFPRFYDQKFRASLPSEFEDHEILPKECVYVSQQYRDVGNFQIAARLCAEFEALENPEDRDAWIVRKTQERQTITAHAQQCEAWHQARLNEQTNKLNDIRNQRKKQSSID